MGFNDELRNNKVAEDMEKAFTPVMKSQIAMTVKPQNDGRQQSKSTR